MKALVPVPVDLRAATEAALAALSPNESAFVVEYVAGGNATAAAEAARFADPATAAHRLRRRAKVVAAIKLLIRQRDAEARVGHERACEILETAISTRLEDFGITANDGTLIDFKDPATLSDGQLARIRKIEAKVHRSGSVGGSTSAGRRTGASASTPIGARKECPVRATRQDASYQTGHQSCEFLHSSRCFFLVQSSPLPAHERPA